MPILKGAVTLARFRVEPDASTPKDWKKQFGRALSARAFSPLDPSGPDERAQGFVELADHDLADFGPGSVHEGEHALFAYRVDEVRIPSAAVKAELEKWAKQFQKENDRHPGKREKADQKAQIRQALRARFPVSTKVWDVSWHVEGGELGVWASTRKAVDEVQEAIEKVFKLKLVPVLPVTVAHRLGFAEKALVPTPELSLPEGEGGRRGEA
jgi:recombination associated protein RdgC